MKATAEVLAGVCYHTTSIVAETSDSRAVGFAFETTCENIERFAKIVGSEGAVDAYREIDPKADSSILAMGHQARCCTDCIVPASALKAMRVAANLAIPGDATISVSNHDGN
jgi:hypothetical protein